MRLFAKKLPKEIDVLYCQIQQTKLALDIAYSNFENAIDPDLIDCYIYEVNAVQKRYKYLLQKIKEIDSQTSYSGQRV